MQRGSIRAQISAIRTRHPKFSVALIGAATIGTFSILGGACASTPIGGPVASGPVPVPAAAIAVQTPVGTPLPVVPSPTPTPTAARQATASPAHVVIVLEENRPLGSKAPYIAALARHGATYANAYAEPNYLALFSGSTHGVSTGDCPVTYSSANLGAQLITSGRTFAGYAESMPRDGYTGCAQGTFTRTHTPWIDFSTVPKASSLTFARFPQDHFDQLPTVSFVTPDLCSDMHDCNAATGDAWLKTNLSAYAKWAKSHDSLLIVTFDGTTSANRVPLIVYGQPVQTGVYQQKVDHYTILRTIEDAYGLPCLGHACDATKLPGL